MLVTWRACPLPRSNFAVMGFGPFLGRLEFCFFSLNDEYGDMKRRCMVSFLMEWNRGGAPCESKKTSNPVFMYLDYPM